MKFKHHLILLVILITFVLTAFIFRGSADIWADEQTTLLEFVLVPLKTTLTSYPYANNHVFFSLILSIPLKFLGINTITEFISITWLVRLVIILFSTTSGLILYSICVKYLNKNTGILVLLLLFSSLPFINFAGQLRGYALSIMLICLLFSSWFNFTYTNKTRYLLLIILWTGLLIYTLPTNIFIPATLGVYLLLETAIKLSKSRTFNLIYYKTHILILIALILGLILSILFYFPIHTDLLNSDTQLVWYPGIMGKINGIIHKSKIFIQDLLPGLLVFFPLILLGFWNSFKKGFNKYEIRILSFSLFLLFTNLPVIFIFSFPNRLLVNYLPFLMIIFGIICQKGLSYFENVRIRRSLLIIIAIATFLALIVNLNISKKITGDQNTVGLKSAHLSHAYYLNNFNKQEVVILAHQKSNSQIPVVMITKYDAPTIYADKYNLKWFEYEKIDQLLSTNDSILLISAGTVNNNLDYNEFLNREDLKKDLITSPAEFYRLYIVQKIN